MPDDDGDAGSEVSFHSHNDEDDEDLEGDAVNGLDDAAATGTYGIFQMLLIKAAVQEAEKTVPQEFNNIRVVDVRDCTFPEEPPTARPRRNVATGAGVAAVDRPRISSKEPAEAGGDAGAGAEEDEDAISEGEHGEVTGTAPWSGKPGSWWRVHNQLGEDLLVREGVSLRSAQINYISPGELVQQAGHARSLLKGNPKGCIRLPVRPNGWVTADATRSGGPKYLVRASVPRWRVVYAPPEPGGKGSKYSQEGTVIVRADEELNSEQVMVLHRGDVVEQAAPSIVTPQGIVRMPVTTTVVRRTAVESGEVPDPSANGQNRATVSGKTYGWVTADASAAGGPVFFKPVAEADRDKYNQQRRRRPKAAA